MQNKLVYATLALSVLAGACASGRSITPVPSAAVKASGEGDGIRVEARASEDATTTETAPSAGSLEHSSTPTTNPLGVDLTAFELPVQYNESVQEYIDLYVQKRRKTFTTWLNRMGRYRSLIEAELERQNLPRELVYLPLIESAYEPSAASHASAVGLWQFMSGTARSEGLEVSEYLDERRDPMRSTEAAARHLRGLYNYFGSWYLSAAAYNTGSTRVGKLLKERGYPKGDDAVFWQLQDALPKETRAYVPMLLAAVIIGEQPDKFGITVTPSEPWQFETVIVPGATELRAVARATGSTLSDIKALNPHYIKSMTPPDRRSEVRVPPGSADGFADAFAKIPKDERTRALTRTHVVKNGETLSGIAKRYGTTVTVLKQVNRIKRPDALSIGRKLQVPIT
jgi:membrane-bound lytic murein transglycosylase D